MAIIRNRSGIRNIRRLVEDGAVDMESDWSFSADDGNELLDVENPAEEREDADWERFASVHLGRRDDEDENTKSGWAFPVAKEVDGEIIVFRSGVIAARQRAAQTDHDNIESTAADLLEMIDADGNGESHIFSGLLYPRAAFPA